MGLDEEKMILKFEESTSRLIETQIIHFFNPSTKFPIRSIAFLRSSIDAA
jgi:hypothetical protein